MNFNGWIAAIAGGAYLLLLGALGVLLVINADLRASLASADAARALLQSQNQQWAAKAAATDAALAKIKALDAANAKAIAKAEAAATAAAKKLQAQAASIASLAFTGSDCAQVLALRAAYLKQFQ